MPPHQIDILRPEQSLGNGVAEIFAALESAGIAYALLRGLEELFADSGHLEIDLLVQREHLSKLGAALAELGFVEIPSWGHAPHHFFVTYSRERAGWVKLDVVTDLVYGAPIRWLRADLSRQCLARRKKHGPVYMLAQSDAFFTLFLHCLLDKGAFREHRQSELLAMARRIGADSCARAETERLFLLFTNDELNWESAVSLIRNNLPAEVKNCKAAVARALLQAEPVGNRWRKHKAKLLRKLRPLWFSFRHRGVWIALLAPDGGGKSTLAKTLVSQPLLRPKLVYMGTNVASSTVGLPSSRFLHKHYKYSEGKPKTLGKKLVRRLVFPNRIMEQYVRVTASLLYSLTGHTVIFDRFVYDSFLAKPPKGPAQRFRRWLLYGLCPHADITFLLDAPGEVLFQRKKEHSPEILERQRQTFLSLRDRIPNMRIVDATQSPEAVQNEVLAAIWDLYRAKQRRTGKSD